jgi:hypothetical protein
MSVAGRTRRGPTVTSYHVQLSDGQEFTVIAEAVIVNPPARCGSPPAPARGNPCTGRDRGIHRQCRRCLRQRVGRDHDRAVQDRSRRPRQPIPGGPVVHDRRSGVGDDEVGRLVQQSPPAQPARLRSTRRMRGRLLRSHPGGPAGNASNIKPASNPRRPHWT